MTEAGGSSTSREGIQTDGTTSLGIPLEFDCLGGDLTLKEKAAKTQTPAAPKPQAPTIDYSKPLQAREDDIDFAAKLGRRKLPADEDLAKSAPFRCETCDFAVMDSNSWLDHLNSPSHNRMIGNHMKVERVSVDRVRERCLRSPRSSRPARASLGSAERERAGCAKPLRLYPAAQEQAED